MDVFKYISRLDDGGQGITKDSSEFFFLVVIFGFKSKQVYDERLNLSTNKIAKFEMVIFLFLDARIFVCRSSS